MKHYNHNGWHVFTKDKTRATIIIAPKIIETAFV
jgi:hypothetical protein